MQTLNETQNLSQPLPGSREVAPTIVRKALGKRSFATLGSSSPAGRPHVAAVLYELVGDDLWINTLRTSRKARNIVDNPHVAVCVPVPRIPFGPASTVHFQARAEVVALGDSQVADLLAGGALKSLTSHGELDLPDGCFVRVGLPARVNTYGLGMSIVEFARHPLAAGGVAVLR